MTVVPKATPSSVNGWNAEYLDAQYSRWQADPDAVTPELQQFFMGFDLGQTEPTRGTAGDNGADAARGAVSAPLTGDARMEEDRAQAAVSALIHQYRTLGHLCAAIDPFGRERACPESLTPAAHGLSEEDLARRFDADSLSPDETPLALSEIIDILDETYCRSVGVEFAHVSNEDEWRWLADRMEGSRNRLGASRKERGHILYQLYRAELFEKFCGKRYPGVKRFSLEGSESLIPLLDQLVELAGDTYKVEEIVFAMSHRGRLNVLTNVIGKTYEQVFTEFEDAWDEDETLGGGDVKYHRGYSFNRILPSGRSIWLAMSSNPSHLEAACPVALGRCRGKQRMHGDIAREQAIPVLIHGDAAVIGQGVVAETYNLSQLEGYTVGGTVHIVVNNLIGFTTGQDDARSSRYCTDMAKMIEAPILHVNGEDPEAVVHAAKLSLEYRMRFKKDIVIDMVCYRRHGHNEMDEAAFTQPLLYKEIRNKPSVLKTYAERLLAEDVISQDDMDKIRGDLDENLDRAFESVKQTPVDPTPDPGKELWAGLSNAYDFSPTDTSVSREELLEISRAMGKWPDNFTPHPKLVKVLEARANCIEQDTPFDWGTAESFAIGSLIAEGNIVRLSGQDSRRGTFSHRHALLRDVHTAEKYVPVNHIREAGVPGTDHEAGTVNEAGEVRQAKFCIYDSPLSEYAVLGFEYGFSLSAPKMLTIWEAQFGDFCNGTQVIIDQFIASAEAKWHRWSGITLLLPHGYEGQGPEHSSARLERFLKLCGQNNMQVCNPTTPAQYFHMLRRQAHRSFRKPLIVMTPKSLLRSKLAQSMPSELIEGTFHEILDDPAMTTKTKKKKVARVLLCSGKVYYDLVDRRTELSMDDVAIVRVEQIYPLHGEMVQDIVESYPEDAELIWVQEEPKNMGAWGHMALTVWDEFGWELPYIGRPASATPATGSPRVHRAQLDEFLSLAVGPLASAKVAAS